MLTVENVNLHYGAAQALRGISLTAEMGRITCVLGRNGVGKSSLLRAVTGQHGISGGSISFDGKVLNGLPPFLRAKQGIGYVPQGREIFPLLTVRENLETGYAPVSRKERFIPDDIFSLFPVLQSMLGRRGGDLSGGQQQQLAIGRALVTRPKILVLDEPRASSRRSSRISAGRSVTCAIPPAWRSCWSNSTSISAASWPIRSTSWIAARSFTRGRRKRWIRRRRGGT